MQWRYIRECIRPRKPVKRPAREAQGSLRFPRSYAFPYIPTRHGIRYLCHADALHAHVHAPWLRPRDSCTLCPAGSGVPDTTHEQTTYARRLARDTYNSCPEATRQKACTNTGTYTRAMARRDSCTLCPAGLDTTRTHHAQTTYARRFARDTYKTCPRGYDEESVYKHARPSEV